MFAMKQLQQELLLEAKRGMLTAEGAESLQDEELVVIANVVIASISGGAWAAMDEFGTGSKMDTSNSALSAYRASGLWNPSRTDNKIRSRKRGRYINIFGEAVNSPSNISGIDLEAIGKVKAQEPSKAIQTAALWMQNGRIQSVIRSTVLNFPFGRFIKTTKT